jgi:hypothetical protein
MSDKISDQVLKKLNTKAFSVLGGLFLIAGGFVMCIFGLTADGSIDLKSAFLDGNIKTGSVGLMSMFLGTVLLTFLNLPFRSYKGEEVKLIVDGHEVTTKGVSYRKLQEVIKAVRNDFPRRNDAVQTVSNQLEVSNGINEKSK